MTHILRHLRHVVFVTLTAAAASCISLIGGIGLEAVAERILPILPLLIALPALNTMVGDYAGVITAHATSINKQKHTTKELVRTISKTIWINIVGLLVLSLALAWRRDYIFTTTFTIKFVLFIGISLVATIFAMFVITRVFDKLLERHRLDSDDVLIPVITSISDTLMLSIITAAVLLVF